MIARIAAADAPTTQIAAAKISRPAGRRRPGGPGTTVPTATGSRLGTAAPGPAAAGPSAEGAVPPAGAGAAGSPEAPTPSSPQPPGNASVGVAARAVPGASRTAPAQAAARAGASRCRSIRWLPGSVGGVQSNHDAPANAVTPRGTAGRPARVSGVR